MVPAPTSRARTPAVPLSGSASRCGEGLGGAAAASAGRRVGTSLKRSFQTFFIASTTMSLLILLSPTLRSTKMMGSSTILKPSLWAR